MDVEERDINRNPPDRAFLETHIDADRFLDFVSTRSPVFKQRPLPRSKLSSQFALKSRERKFGRNSS